MTEDRELWRLQLQRIDKLFASSNPAVKDLLEQALVVAEIVTEEDTTTEIGPLENMFNDHIAMAEELALLSFDIQRIKNSQSGTYWTDTIGTGDPYYHKLPAFNTIIKSGTGTGT